MADTRTDGSKQKLTLRELEERAKRSTSKELADAATEAIRDLRRQREIVDDGTEVTPLGGNPESPAKAEANSGVNSLEI